VLLLIGGVWADRLPRQLVMLSADAARAGSQTLIGVLLVTGHAQLWELALTQTFSGACDAFFNPASTGALAVLVEPARRQQAFGLFGLVGNVSEILGPALAGILILVVEPGWLLVAHAGMLAISAVLISACGPLGVAELEPGESLRAQTREGFRYVRGQRWLVTVIASSALAQFSLLSCLNVLGPVVAKESLGGAPAWATVVTALGAGAIGGSVLALQYRPRRPLAVGYRFLFLGAGPTLLLLAIPAPLAVILVSEFASGVAIGFFGVLELAAVTWHVPPPLVSRVDAINRLGSMALYPVGMAVVAPIAVYAGVRATLAGAAVLSMAAVVWPLAVREVRELGRGDLVAGERAAAA
jgi:MFS family permease